MTKAIKKPRDVNQIAKMVVDTATKAKEKNPFAVGLGRLGGLKGGKARAKTLTAKRRTEIAKKAAKARWKRK